ncbi:MAG: metallophosphoesterase family protein, partial [Phenylobacterium sp.]
ACSGVPGALHETTFSQVCNVVGRLEPGPEFVIFPGDEIIGLTPDEAELRSQWRHWLEVETAWLDRDVTPIWHATGNHTTYNRMSERVFREVLGMPRNGPPGQEGLSYYVRRGDLLLIFVHTLATDLGGEGYVDVAWLEGVLAEHRDAGRKIVVGHHPVYSVNGFSGAYQRDIGPEHAGAMWEVLVREGVLAYVCSHILAFDVQVHRGVLQLCTAGAGTAHRMPEGVEYLHCVQAALDHAGLRYQVLDESGRRREQLAWPLPPFAAASPLRIGTQDAPLQARLPERGVLDLSIAGTTASSAAQAQTLFCTNAPGSLPMIWIGLRGPKQRLTAIIARTPGRSPHFWQGPAFGDAAAFTLDLRICPAMGAGGLLWRTGPASPWSSLIGASPTGVEGTDWPSIWRVGAGLDSETFLGQGLRASWGLSEFAI